MKLQNLERTNSDVPICNSVCVSWRRVGKSKPITAINSNPTFIPANSQEENSKQIQAATLRFTGSKITLERHRFIEMEKERNEFEIEMARAMLRFTG
ncbi:hypothetical protein LXL04_016459 [Taraxacum kok-saghyz]